MFLYPEIPSLYLTGSLIVVQSSPIGQSPGMSRIGESRRYFWLSLRILFLVVFRLGHDRERNVVYDLYGFAIFLQSRFIPGTSRFQNS